MTDVFNSMSPEEQSNYIQQVIRTILIDPNPSILDVALLPILATDSRNGFSEETRKELMHVFTNHCTLLEQMAQINMSHANIITQFNNSMQARVQAKHDDEVSRRWEESYRQSQMPWNHYTEMGG